LSVTTISVIFSCALFSAGALVGQAIVSVDQSIPSDVRPSFQAVGSDVYSRVVDMFHGRPPLDLPITVHHSGGPPRTSLNDWSAPTALLIDTTVTKWYPDQFVFQFAHEMGHVMLNPRRNSGFVDAICVALSLEILSQLSVKWETAAPVNGLRGNFLGRYRGQYESEVLTEVPGEIAAAVSRSDWTSVAMYLRAHREEIEPTNPKYRITQLLAALVILSKPVKWEDLRGIAACTDPDTKVDPSFRILPVSVACMEKIKDIGCRIGSECLR